MKRRFAYSIDDERIIHNQKSIENDFFVASDGTVYKAPHQAGETMYRYDDNGNIVQAYYYNNRI